LDIFETYVKTEVRHSMVIVVVTRQKTLLKPWRLSTNGCHWQKLSWSFELCQMMRKG